MAVADCFAGLERVSTLSTEKLERRPPHDDAWSVLEHLEHVLLANHFLLLTIKKGCRIALKRRGDGRELEGESDLDLLATIAVPGAFEWEPPLHMVPTGKCQAGELPSELLNQKRECLGLLESMPAGEGRLYSIRMSVNNLGRLDMYQWIYFLVQHARYHLALIEEILDPQR